MPQTDSFAAMSGSKRGKGTDPRALRRRGVLLLSVLLLVFLGVRWEADRPAKGKSVPQHIPNPRWILEVRGAVGRSALLNYTRPPTLSQILKDTETPTPKAVAGKDESGLLFDQEVSLVFFPDPHGGLGFRREPLSVKALWLLGRPLPLNRAAPEELDLIPGIGPVLARRIVDYREAVGGFTSLDQLKEVKGVKEKNLESIKAYLTIE